jgi:nicotinamidase/pyrazinamidase
MSAPAPPRRSRIPKVQNFEYSDSNNDTDAPPAYSITDPSSPSNKKFEPKEDIAHLKLKARQEDEADLPVFKSGIELLTIEPDMTIGEQVSVKGDMKFENLLRIDGTVQGNLNAPKSAGLIIGETGTLIGNVLSLGCMLIEGKVIGNINAESICLCETGVVHGDIAARSVDVKHNSTFVGQLHISAFDPLAVVDPLTGKIDITRKHGQYLLSDDNAEEYIADQKHKRHKARKAARKAAKEAGEEIDIPTDGETDSEDIDNLIPNTKRKRTTMFIIDPQNDFHGSGSCSLSGADQDAERIAEFIYSNMNTIDEIMVTLDSHHRMHIAHAAFWIDEHGNEPPLYTVISIEDVINGKWQPKDDTLISHCKFYLTELERNGRHGLNTLIIKPEHCLIGTKGHAVTRIINDALQDWAVSRMRKISYIFKGTNCLTDMTSALCADVEIVEDPTTSFDPDLLLRLHAADHLIVCGQSLSHGLNATMRDLLTHWQGSKARISLLEDCSSVDNDLTSALLTTKKQHYLFDPARFWIDMRGAGVNVARSTEAMLSKKQ